MTHVDVNTRMLQSRHLSLSSLLRVVGGRTCEDSWVKSLDHFPPPIECLVFSCPVQRPCSEALILALLTL